MANTKNTSQYDLAVFIGRFQPFHEGHRMVVEAAAKIADNVLILVGSSYRARSWKNPFLYEERKDFIKAAIRGEDWEKDISILPLVDTLYNDKTWAANVRMAVSRRLRSIGIETEGARIVIIGGEKDNSSAYLRWFPEWNVISLPIKSNSGERLDATTFRKRLFLENGDGTEVFGDRHVAQTREWAARNPDIVHDIADEGRYVMEYRNRVAKAEKALGFPITINTVDSVVIQSGHVLLVERANKPGKGLLALPGGHIDRDETALEAAVRELYEECRIDMPRAALAGRLRQRVVFDHPTRSDRAWVRTEAFLFNLPDNGRLEKIRGGSDAARAIWTPLDSVTPERMFEDHFDILQRMAPEIPFAYGSVLMATGNG